MFSVLSNLNRSLLLGGTLLVLSILILNDNALDITWFNAFLRFLHALVGVLWIGLLYYFNFVQIPIAPQLSPEQKPAITKYIAPEALFWFRWAALATLVLGLAIAGAMHYLIEALTFQEGYRNIGLGMWLGIIMAANVWMFIWPNQKIALGIVDIGADADTKAKHGRTAMLFSRTNFVLSFPMLYCMVTRGVLG
jgi:uncharacterized membrane protein